MTLLCLDTKSILFSKCINSRMKRIVNSLWVGILWVKLVKDSKLKICKTLRKERIKTIDSITNLLRSTGHLVWLGLEQLETSITMENRWKRAFHQWKRKCIYIIRIKLRSVILQRTKQPKKKKEMLKKEWKNTFGHVFPISAYIKETEHNQNIWPTWTPKKLKSTKKQLQISLWNSSNVIQNPLKAKKEKRKFLQNK